MRSSSAPSRAWPTASWAWRWSMRAIWSRRMRAVRARATCSRAPASRPATSPGPRSSSKRRASSVPPPVHCSGPSAASGPARPRPTRSSASASRTRRWSARGRTCWWRAAKSCWRRSGVRRPCRPSRKPPASIPIICRPGSARVRSPRNRATSHGPGPCSPLRRTACARVRPTSTRSARSRRSRATWRRRRRPTPRPRRPPRKVATTWPACRPWSRWPTSRSGRTGSRMQRRPPAD